MPLISKGMYSNTSSGDSGNNDFRNPKSLWRNTVRIKPGEHAVLRFITDFTNGDMSRFHGIPGMTAKGQQFTSYEYCSRINVNESGRVIDKDCEHCLSADERIVKTTSRYLSWVMHYGTFHVDQNPFLDRDDQEPWDLITKGNRQFYRETIKKPQLLNTSFTLFKNSLPDLELIAAKLITEVDVPTFNTDKADNEIPKADAESAYANMSNLKFDEEVSDV